jgi:hypothetical protein
MNASFASFQVENDAGAGAFRPCDIRFLPHLADQPMRPGRIF